GVYLSPGAISLIEQSPLDKFFNQVELQIEVSTQEEIKLTQELANKSSGAQPHEVEGFISDVVSLKDDFSLENVSELANKWLNLEKIDAGLDKHFSDKDNLQYAQFQNWMASVFAKFMGPEAEKLVNLLRPLNKIFWLLVDKSGLGQLMLWLKKTFKRWVGMNLLFGAVVGIGTFLVMGPLIGLGAGIITYFITPSPGASAGSALSSTAMRVNMALGHVGTAAIASFTSFLAIIFVVFLFIPILVALMLFIINTSALVVPPNASPFSGSDSQIGFVSENVFCTDTASPLAFPDTATNAVAKRAYNIVSNLKQGFWCYWNRHPEYINLFNLSEYQKFPNHCVYETNFPPQCKGDYRAIGSGESLFWCTWLIVEAFKAAGQTLSVNLLGANAMKEFFINQGRFVPNTSQVFKRVAPGDAIFLSTARDNPNYAGHTAIVYQVGQDYIRTLDSNASQKSHSYTVDSNGSIQGLPGLNVIGFGKLNP
ncbi:MAG: CHAP domain-containing protein, partial [Patescibacteria group bacterium]